MTLNIIVVVFLGLWTLLLVSGLALSYLEETRRIIKNKIYCLSAPIKVKETEDDLQFSSRVKTTTNLSNKQMIKRWEELSNAKNL